MPWPHSPHAPCNPSDPRPVGTCDRCNFLYPLAQLHEQREWAGLRIVGAGVRCCPRCLDELQENGKRTVILSGEPTPIKNVRPTRWSTQEGGRSKQFVLDDPGNFGGEVLGGSGPTQDFDASDFDPTDFSAG